MWLKCMIVVLLSFQCCGAKVYSDIPSLLQQYSSFSPPMVPSSLNTALRTLVGDINNFVEYPDNLQRAMLWNAGWVRVIPESAGSGSASDGMGQYVQMYVQCGFTMSSIFQSASEIEDDSLCPIKTCKEDIISYTESTCEPSSVKIKTLCALSPEADSFNAALHKSEGPIWSRSGQLDESFDPQFHQFSNNNSGNPTIYMLAQKNQWSMGDDTCPNAAQFIVPCRKVSADEITGTWCVPPIESWVMDWVKNETKSTDSMSNTAENGVSSGLSTLAIVGIIAGSIVAVLVVLAFAFARKRRSKSSQGQSGLWDDDVITAHRIPREKVRIDQLLSRGAFGEVYAGVYNGEHVAIKMLLPSTRRDIKLVNEFLAEAKLTATMDHPRIVSCVGVAWDSLSDLCVVLEFMGGGDLRTLLSNYEKSGYPVGFNREKTTIALHVAHALTYLHSLEPPVIHRDLKSRNILLNSLLEAKLTDFGISRERLDRTMTAGVGTSLWMAPEVMTGEKYDEKADMFSFGVVLSELDVHTLPYAQAKQEMQHSLGRQMTDATLLQRVAMGAIRVNFSTAGPQSMLELGRACIAVDPSARPTAAEALFKLHEVLSKEMALSIRDQPQR